jgi:hypothetical protein
LGFSNISREAKAQNAFDLAKMHSVVALDHHFHTTKALGARPVKLKNLCDVGLGRLTEFEELVLVRIAHDSCSHLGCKRNPASLGKNRFRWPFAQNVTNRRASASATIAASVETGQIHERVIPSTESQKGAQKLAK